MACADVVPACLNPNAFYKRGGGQPADTKGSGPQTLLSLNIYDARAPWACFSVRLEMPCTARGTLYIKGILKVLEGS